MSAKVTPMMEQYKATKAQHPDEILFFRLGDFYEMFFDDARLVSRELGLTLTSRSGDMEHAPMCGLPYHASESYIARLIARGYKIAIAEQIGDPKAPGLTKREVIKVVTPGTVMSEDALPSAQNNYIALVYVPDNENEKNKIVLVGADISTGECFYGIYRGKGSRESLFDELYRLMMPELVLVGNIPFRDELDSFIALRMDRCAFTEIAHVSEHMERLSQHFTEDNQPEDDDARAAVATLLDYLHDTVMTDLSHLNRITYIDSSDNLVLDAFTLRNLEITRNLRDGGKKNTLYDVLDFTRTAMGGRLLKRFLEAPLVSVNEIDARLDAVSELAGNYSLRDGLAELLKSIYDFERLLTRAEVGTSNARDLVALRISFETLPKIKNILSDAKSSMLMEANENIKTYDELAELLARAIVDEPPLTVREGGIIKPGYNTELDEYRRIAHDSKSLLQEMEEREKEKTGIKTLKIGYNKVFGYYIEVRNSGKDLVPENYIRKQTLANAERYITPELKDFETKILGAQEKIVNIEYAIFSEIREKVAGEVASVQETARKIALLDVLVSFAEAAASYNYVRPNMRANGEIKIRDGRHPLVERILASELFVPNDAELNHSDSEIMLITGPNMAGKSTYMRQTALITLMAQVGCFVPAREATISPVDRIFTRIGASDDLVSGQSTFMVEMNEVADILTYATKNSLVILDEIGRGTSTYDGMSIARAVVEHIRDHIHAKTMFATHYHELTDMEGGCVKNYCVAVKERGGKVAFLRRIIAGSADKSYGIHVARLAGIPISVTKRAQEILDDLENTSNGEETHRGQSTNAKSSNDTKKSLNDDVAMDSLFNSALSDEILSLDVMSMTPIEAINELYRLQERAKKETGKS
ncbi:MAG: DNA mismatch repair protein MutS [Schwartzia sp.]|nr:DNA mismatch repair protein MutS [Schwartzia sp. (in: firmicutes)]